MQAYIEVELRLGTFFEISVSVNLLLMLGSGGIRSLNLVGQLFVWEQCENV